MKSSFLVLFLTTLTLALGIAGCGSNNPTEPARPWDSVGSRIDPNASSSTAPVITALTPSSGMIGTPVVITGARFGNSRFRTSVYFNGTIAQIDSITATTIYTHVPTGAQTGAVIVIVDTLSSIVTPEATFTVQTPPTIQGNDYTQVGVTISYITGIEYETNNGVDSQMPAEDFGYSADVSNVGTNVNDKSGVNSLDILYSAPAGNSAIIEEVTARVDPVRQLLTSVTFMHHQNMAQNSGSDAAVDIGYEFQMQNLPYVMEPDGTLRCSLSGTALAGHRITIAGHEEYQSHGYGYTKRTGAINPFIPLSSVEFIFRHK